MRFGPRNTLQSAMLFFAAKRTDRALCAQLPFSGDLNPPPAWSLPSLAVAAPMVVSLTSLLVFSGPLPVWQP